MSATSDIWFDEDLGVVRLRYAGVTARQALAAGAREAILLARQHGVSVTLADFSAATIAMTTSEIFELPGMFESLARQEGLAIHQFHQHVVMAQGWQDFDFFADVSNNRGQRATLHRTLDEALAAIRATG